MPYMNPYGKGYTGKDGPLWHSKELHEDSMISITGVKEPSYLKVFKYFIMVTRNENLWKAFGGNIGLKGYLRWEVEKVM